MILAQRLWKKRLWLVRDNAKISQKCLDEKLSVSRRTAAKWKYDIRLIEIEKDKVYRSSMMNFWEVI